MIASGIKKKYGFHVASITTHTPWLVYVCMECQPSALKQLVVFV